MKIITPVWLCCAGGQCDCRGCSIWRRIVEAIGADDAEYVERAIEEHDALRDESHRNDW